MRVTIELDAEQACALKRFAEKVSYDQAQSVLYPHVNADTRTDQAYEIVSAFLVLEKALANAKVSAWPWIDTGKAA